MRRMPNQPASGGHSGASGFIGYLLNQAAGAVVDPATATGMGSNGNDSWTGGTIVLRPA
jgi:hypothetical protein